MRDMSLPEPLSSPECNLRGLQWMPLNAEDLLDSDLFLESTGDEFKAAIALICKSWRQVPAGSLPSKEESLATLSMAKDWTSVRTMALRNWVLCSDGRYYHPVVAAKAMEALPHRQEFEEKKSADAERKERERKDRKDMFARLKAAGIVLPYNTHTTELRQRVAQLQADPVTPDVTGTADVSRDLSRLGQGHDLTSPDLTGIQKSSPVIDGESPPAGGDDAADAEGKVFELTGGDAPVKASRPDIPACPHLKLLELWREVLPELPQHDPDEWGGQRRDNLQARWREKAAKLQWANQEQGLVYFRRLFRWIRNSPWCMGQVPPAPGKRLFQLELQWLVRPNNWPNVLEGKYHEAKKD